MSKRSDDQRKAMFANMANPGSKRKSRRLRRPKPLKQSTLFGDQAFFSRDVRPLSKSVSVKKSGKLGDAVGQKSLDKKDVQSAIKSSTAEDFIKDLGLTIIPVKQKKGQVLFQLSGDNRVINVPKGYDLSSPSAQHSLYHEVGHYFDEASFSGGRMKSNVDAKRFKSKYSLKSRELLSKHQEYIINLRGETIHNVDFRFTTKEGKTLKFTSIDDLRQSKVIPSEFKLKFLRSYNTAVRKYRDYRRQPPELFAEGFALYALNRGKLKRENIELYNFYDKIFRENPKLEGLKH